MISRRRFVYSTALALAGCSAIRSGGDSLSQDDVNGYPFTLGIASGDPTADSVILWTRLAPDPLSDTYLSAPVPVSWIIAKDPELLDVVQVGSTVALAENAHCVHVDARNLEPDEFYFYQFETSQFKSLIGRTRTLPAPGTELSEFSIGLTSCQEYSQGYFSAYRDLIDKQPNVVVHNGDYIYEAPSGSVRPYPVEVEAQTLSEYRSLYAQYRQDGDLRAAHAQFPWFVIWDDHEVVNDWGPDHYLPSSRNELIDISEHKKRVRAATKAFLEHMPLRASSVSQQADVPRFYRRNVIGDLLEISHLDVRSYRDPPACNNGLDMRFTACEEAYDENRSMLGDAQEEWLLSSFASSGCRWNCISQATIMAAFDRTAGPKVSYETDSWDNYPASRRRILDHIQRNKIRNSLSLGGNIHAFYAGVVSAENQTDRCNPVLTEIVTTSITANGGDIERYKDVQGRREENPCIEFFENRFHGYTLLEFTKEQVKASLRIVDGIEAQDGKFSTLATLIIEDGQPGANLVDLDQPNSVA